MFANYNETLQINIVYYIPWHSYSSKQCDRAPSQYITKMHGYIQAVCQDSKIPGIEYYAGPLAQCKECGKKEVVEFVQYKDGQSHRIPSPHCSLCFKRYDVDSLLKAQVSNLIGLD